MTAARSTPRPLAAVRAAAASAASASRGRAPAVSVSRTATTACVAGGSDADDGGQADAVEGLQHLLEPDGRQDARGGGDDVAQPALDPQATLGVEVAHVTRAVPGPGPRRVLLRPPQPEVPVLDVRGVDQDLTGDTRRHGGCAGRGSRRRRAG